MSKFEDAQEALVDAIIRLAPSSGKNSLGVGGEIRNLAGAYEALVGAECTQEETEKRRSSR